MAIPEQTELAARTEASVAELLAGRDLRAAATEAIRGYGDELFRFFMAVLRDEEEAAECFAVFSEMLWRGLPEFRGDSSLRTWCYVLARSAMARRLRDPHRRAERAVPLSRVPELEQMVQRVRTETLAFLKTEVKDRFARLREQLSEEEQMLLFLRVDRDLGWNEIAVILADGGSLSEVALPRRAASLRKQFQRTKEKLSKLARSDGLL